MGSSLKRCGRCKQHKERSKFYNDRRSKDGLCYDCIDCRKAYYNRPGPNIEFRTCTNANCPCVNPQPGTEFRKFRTTCRECGRRAAHVYLDMPGAKERRALRQKLRRADPEVQRHESEQNKAWRSKPENAQRIKDRMRKHLLEKSYGMTIEQYDALLKAQDGKCAICKKVETYVNYRTRQVKRLAVDHDHKTGRVRGLLCNRCNRALGIVENIQESLPLFVDYLRRNSDRVD